MTETADIERTASDLRLRRARAVTLTFLGTGVLTSLILAGFGLLFERDVVWIVLGGLGIVAFVAAQVGALYAVVTPWSTELTRRRLLAAYAASAALSVPLVGPVGADRWATWAWLGSSIVGTVPLLVRRWAAALVTVATLAVAVGVARWTGGSIGDYALITVCVGLAVRRTCSVRLRPAPRAFCPRARLAARWPT